MPQLLSILQNYTEYVGTKSTFRLLNRGSAKALDKVVELDGMYAIWLFPLSVRYQLKTHADFYGCRNEKGGTNC
jgi:hypothetical protein